MRRDTARSRFKAVPAPTVQLLLQDVADGIRVLRTRDGLELTNEQILERARNIVTGLLGNYSIRALDQQEVRAVGDARATARPRPRPIEQMDLLAKLEERAEERNNGQPGRA